MRERLDILLTKKGLVKSRSMAVSLIKNGKISVDRKTIKKPSELVSCDAKIEITEIQKFVGRGGEKLAMAISTFKIDVSDLIALDIGSSTGGFTDCLLQNDAKKVFAVDVGTGQLAPELSKDLRVISLEKTDIRKLEKLPNGELADIAVIDVSFISLTLIFPHLKKFLKPNAKIVALVKPQFELTPGDINKSGIVKTSELQNQALEKIISWCKENGFQILDQIDSPILGGKGNKEFLIYLQTNN